MIFQHAGEGFSAIFTASLPAALVIGLLISMIIYKIGKRNRADYDWRVLWLSVSIIVFVLAMLLAAWNKF
ncbi:MAG: hypothetical protein LBR87_05320 [Synergistaceae bacterium]|nr:hypothetical protein [Synergistaceae bacterium]